MPGSPSPLLTCQSVSLTRGNRLILDSLDLDLHGGSLTALLGPNGAGKSSLLKCLTGELAYEGSISLFGRERQGWAGDQLDIGLGHAHLDPDLGQCRFQRIDRREILAGQRGGAKIGQLLRQAGQRIPDKTGRDQRPLHPPPLLQNRSVILAGNVIVCNASRATLSPAWEGRPQDESGASRGRVGR